MSTAPTEPPDGTRLEFEYYTDVYAAWRDDESSRRAGWRAGDGGYVWCLYGHSVLISWHALWLMFGESLRLAVRLEPHPEDVHKYDLWPTIARAQEEGGTNETTR